MVSIDVEAECEHVWELSKFIECETAWAVGLRRMLIHVRQRMAIAGVGLVVHVLMMREDVRECRGESEIKQCNNDQDQNFAQNTYLYKI